MTAIRRNIMTDQTTRDQYVEGVRLLDEEFPGVTAQDVFNFLQTSFPQIRMRGREQPLSTYDIFVLWHIIAMSVPLDVGNAAHSGPIFLPWHRMYLIQLEIHLQRVLNDADFGLPYWDWAADGELPSADQYTTPLWNATGIGESRGQVTQGPVGDIRVRLFSPGQGQIISDTPRPIQRQASNASARRLPRKSEVQDALDATAYDEPEWDNNTEQLRNILEGWHDGPALHNRVHVWVGGDMGPGSSPNDPVFYLNHCNVDRIWEAWMMNNSRDYRPQVGEGPQGHRINDVMVSIIGDSMRPIDVLDPAQWYSYDDLNVAS